MRLVVLSGCVSLLVLGVVVFFSNPTKTQNKIIDKQAGEKFLPIKVNQLSPSEQNIIPIQLECTPARLPLPNKLEDVSCTLTNNTD